jgi:hypothetical protein
MRLPPFHATQPRNRAPPTPPQGTLAMHVPEDIGTASVKRGCDGAFSAGGSWRLMSFALDCHGRVTYRHRSSPVYAQSLVLVVKCVLCCAQRRQMCLVLRAATRTRRGGSWPTWATSSRAPRRARSARDPPPPLPRAAAAAALSARARASMFAGRRHGREAMGRGADLLRGSGGQGFIPTAPYSRDMGRGNSRG